MGFERKVPDTAGDLMAYLKQVHENRSHVASIRVDFSKARLEIDLDSAANFFGHPDMYMPIKRAQLSAAKEFVERITTQSAAGFAPTDADAKFLFDMIDPAGQ